MLRDTHYFTNGAIQGRYLMRTGRKAVAGRNEHGW